MDQRLPVARPSEVVINVSKSRQPLCFRAQQHNKVLVHFILQSARVQVIVIRAEGVFYLNCNAIQGPQDEHADEGEHKSPARIVDPLGRNSRRDKPVQYQEEVTGLSIWEGERNR